MVFVIIIFLKSKTILNFETLWSPEFQKKDCGQCICSSVSECLGHKTTLCLSYLAFALLSKTDTHMYMYTETPMCTCMCIHSCVLCLWICGHTHKCTCMYVRTHSGGGCLTPHPQGWDESSTQGIPSLLGTFRNFPLISRVWDYCTKPQSKQNSDIFMLVFNPRSAWSSVPTAPSWLVPFCSPAQTMHPGHPTPAVSYLQPLRQPPGDCSTGHSICLPTGSAHRAALWVREMYSRRAMVVEVNPTSCIHDSLYGFMFWIFLHHL